MSSQQTRDLIRAYARHHGHNHTTARRIITAGIRARQDTGIKRHDKVSVAHDGKARRWWDVRAVGGPFVVITRQAPFRPKGELCYAVCDFVRGVRGPLNILGGGHECTNDEDCMTILRELMSMQFEVTYRRPAPLEITGHQPCSTSPGDLMQRSDANLRELAGVISRDHPSTDSLKISLISGSASRTSLHPVVQVGYDDHGEAADEYEVDLIDYPVDAHGGHHLDAGCVCADPDAHLSSLSCSVDIDYLHGI